MMRVRDYERPDVSRRKSLEEAQKESIGWLGILGSLRPKGLFFGTPIQK
jgi:hypothetical protein